MSVTIETKDVGEVRDVFRRECECKTMSEDLINKCVGLFYLKIDCSIDDSVLEKAITLVPKNATSDRILESIYELIECLDDESFNDYRFKLRWILFNRDYRIAREQNQEINIKLSTMVTNKIGKVSDRAYFLLSHKIEELLKKAESVKQTFPSVKILSPDLIKTLRR